MNPSRDATRRQWDDAIHVEYIRGMTGWHLSLLVLAAWLRAMVKLHKIVEGD